MKSKLLVILLILFLFLFLCGCSNSNSDEFVCVVKSVITDDSGMYNVIDLKAKDDNKVSEFVTGYYVTDADESLYAGCEVIPSFENLKEIELTIGEISYKFYKLDSYTILK